jgi:CubicO group peptidase (beta-lactamase class C family)
MSMAAAARARLALAVVVIVLVALPGAPRVWRWYQASRAGAIGYHPSERLAGGNEPPAPRVAPESELLDRSALEAAADYAGAHGSRALIVARHDHIVFERYWRGSGFDTLADAQSFTRLLAALATGVAISHRVIGWPDEPIGAFIAEWSHDPRGGITVRNLLQSASGLGQPATAAGGTDLVAGVLSAPLAGTPGSRRVDQAADPQLLALVLERATHQRYAGYVSQALWRRIGAADAWLWLDRPGGAAHAGCCLLARQGDWIRVAELLLADGRYRGAEVIRPGWVGLMRAPAKADPDYGAYLRVGSRPPGGEPYAMPDVFAVEGEGGNRMWLVPSLQIAILCTGERAGRDALWNEARIPNLIIRGARDYLAPPARPGADVSGLVPAH